MAAARRGCRACVARPNPLVGADLSPPLEWTGVPGKVVELALVMEDPDTPFGTFDHWILYGMSATTRGLPEGGTSDASVGKAYGGPCPPPGDGVHRYIFTVYALSAPTNLAPGADKRALYAAMEGNVVAAGRLTGTYSR